MKISPSETGSYNTIFFSSNAMIMRYLLSVLSQKRKVISQSAKRSEKLPRNAKHAFFRSELRPSKLEGLTSSLLNYMLQKNK